MMTSIFNTFFPKVCLACDEVLLKEEELFCLHCLHQLPIITQQAYAEALIEEHFYGRLPIAHAAALFLFRKKGVGQQILHQLKYKGHQEIGAYLGKWLGSILVALPWSREVDYIIPVPLSKRRKRTRGYNQVAGFGKALAKKLKIKYREDILFKISDVSTQVFKNRQARSAVDKGVFKVKRQEELNGKHLLLIDDLITTGATLDACAEALQIGNPSKISLATMAITV